MDEKSSTWKWKSICCSYRRASTWCLNKPGQYKFYSLHISTYTVIYSLHISTYTVISAVVYWPVSRTSWVNLYHHVKPLWILLEYWLSNGCCIWNIESFYCMQMLISVQIRFFAPPCLFHCVFRSVKDWLVVSWLIHVVVSSDSWWPIK